MDYKSLTKILRTPILQGSIPSLERTLRLVLFSPKPEVCRGLNQNKSYVHLWKNNCLSLSVQGYLRATVCKYRPKSTFCGTSSKFEFRSFLAHR